MPACGIMMPVRRNLTTNRVLRCAHFHTRGYELVLAAGSPRVGGIFDVGEVEDGTRYMLMEYVRGRSLAEVIKDDGPLPVLEALLIACRVADSLTLAHQKGIIHRDVKPSNLILMS